MTALWKLPNLACKPHVTCVDVVIFGTEISKRVTRFFFKKTQTFWAYDSSSEWEKPLYSTAYDDRQKNDQSVHMLHSE